jgi:purine-nucleoside phosphorylase
MFTQEQSLKILAERVSKFPATLAVLGSGWNRALATAEIETEIPYTELFGVGATVPGHAGKLVIATIKGKRVAVMSGRFHTYEGFTAREATLPIRVCAQAGAQQLILTAASGALNEKYRVGDFVILNDVISLFLALDNPLVGPQFLDTSELFDPAWRSTARQVLVAHDLPFHEGSYCYYHGPNYETPADKMALRFLGADCVGMSVVPEVLVARWLKMKILGLAFITNLAFVKHDHQEVIATAEKAGDQMAKLLAGVL